MATIRYRFWDLAYALLLIIAIPVAVFHAVQDRWAQAILATIAAGIGAAILVTDWNRPREPAPAGVTPSSGGSNAGQPSKIDMERLREDSGRLTGWAPMSVVSGFVATGIMTAAVLLGYGVSALLASEAAGANQLQVWLSALIDNTVTEIATVNLAFAIAIHFIAGIGWAVIYAAYAEPRLSGTGLQRGVKFGLLPWALSIVVFFPVVGAGFFGAGIDAGPLPVLGNLILHIVYGGALGKIYASHAIWKEPVSEVTSDNIRILEIVHRTMAIGLLPGAVLGVFAALIGVSVFAPDLDLVMAGVLGALVGSAVGIWIGSLAGLTPENLNSSDKVGV